MPFALEDLIPFIPNLRRYARLLSCSSEVGDEFVRLCLELMKADPARLQGDSLRVELYRAFHEIDATIARAAGPRNDATTLEQRLEQGLAALTPIERQVLILAVTEGFKYKEIGQILGIKYEKVREELSRARQKLKRVISLPVLIIEDEAPIAIELRQLLQEMGLTVIQIVAREEEAAQAVDDGQLGLVLADIQLQDDGSGIAVAEAILRKYQVPIVFVTAFPERLMTGSGLEPAFVVAKPFNTEGLKVTVAQALATYESPADATKHRAALLAKLKQLSGSSFPIDPHAN